jgi:hypothetical protein
VFPKAAAVVFPMQMQEFPAEEYWSENNFLHWTKNVTARY